jgi:hypothetical protein
MSVELNFAFECSVRPFTQGFGVDVFKSVIQSEESGQSGFDWTDLGSLVFDSGLAWFGVFSSVKPSDFVNNICHFF